MLPVPFGVVLGGVALLSGTDGVTPLGGTVGLVFVPLFPAGGIAD